MESVYRFVIVTSLWLGIAGFALGVGGMVAARQWIFNLTPSGMLHGAVALLLITVAAWCARDTHRS
jgi:hypothetical protein